MCGIAGFLQFKPDFSSEELENRLRKITNSLIHRGPDDSGFWVDEKTGIGLGQRRLSIIDLSPAGHQPMFSACGRYVIVFNGEIYNYSEMKQKLPEVKFRGSSDTEVLLEYVARFGLSEALSAANGMFAFALWDKEAKKLSLARDRFGQKPLYYGFAQNSLLFASELKAFRAYDGFNATIRRDAVALLMRHSFIPAPYTVYEEANKLPAGCFVEFPEGRCLRDCRPQSYWSAIEAAQKGKANLFAGSEDEATDILENLLTDAIGGCMIADVPLGSFLSGGIDSSTVVALMQKQSSRPVKTFSIGFDVKGYNEAEHAKAVAAHLKTEHTEQYVTEADARAVIPSLPAMYDEPFADVSQIPTHLVAKMARQHVTVCLSGAGGDELFGGYNRYQWASKISRFTQAVPLPLRKLTHKVITALPVAGWDNIGEMVKPILPKRLRFANVGDKMHKLADFLEVKTQDELYLRLLSQWQNPLDLVPDAKDLPTPVNHSLEKLSFLGGSDNFISRMMLLDALYYMSDDILVKVDRAAMAVSLETRVPLIDHRVFEFAWSLPQEMKINAGVGKHLLRKVLYRHVPQELIERPKMGFGVPIDKWLRGELKDWAGDLLSAEKLKTQGFFDADLVQKTFAEHLSGRRNFQYRLWPVLMFSAWLESQK